MVKSLTVSVRIPIAHKIVLEKIARERVISRSDLIRRIIQEYLEPKEKSRPQEAYEAESSQEQTLPTQMTKPNERPPIPLYLSTLARLDKFTSQPFSFDPPRPSA